MGVLLWDGLCAQGLRTNVGQVEWVLERRALGGRSELSAPEPTERAIPTRETSSPWQGSLLRGGGHSRPVASRALARERSRTARLDFCIARAGRSLDRVQREGRTCLPSPVGFQG